jgi:hypothetical protein
MPLPTVEVEQQDLSLSMVVTYTTTTTTPTQHHGDILNHAPSYRGSGATGPVPEHGCHLHHHNHHDNTTPAWDDMGKIFNVLGVTADPAMLVQLLSDNGKQFGGLTHLDVTGWNPQ